MLISQGLVKKIQRNFFKIAASQNCKQKRRKFAFKKVSNLKWRVLLAFKFSIDYNIYAQKCNCEEKRTVHLMNKDSHEGMGFNHTGAMIQQKMKATNLVM